MNDSIIGYLAWYVNRLTEILQHADWSEETRKEEIIRIMETFNNGLRIPIDWESMTVKEAKLLQFKPWSIEYPNLYLIPLYLVPVIPVGMELTDIFGRKIKYDGSNLGNDVRCGCIAYGIEIEK